MTGSNACNASAGSCAGANATKVPLTALPGFELLSASSLVAILALVCVPPLHKLSRSLLRPTVVFHVERGLEWVALAQRNQRTLLTTLCSLSCFTVSVTFYVSLLPLLIWGGELELASRLISLICCCEYVGNGVKDLICAPRPMGHPKGAGKTKLLLSEKSGKEDAKVHSLEYGLPSSHTMHALCCNFYVAHYFASAGIVPPAWSFAAYVLAALWVAWIGFSRVYMGMHTPIDIGGGAVIAIMVLSTYLSIDDQYAEWEQNSKYAFPAQLLLSAVMLKLHPLPLKHTPSYENSVIVAAVAVGKLAGLQLAHRGLSREAPLPASPGGYVRLAQRVVLGGVVTGVARIVTKQLALRTLGPVYRACPVVLRRLWRPPIHNQLPSSELAAQGVPVDAAGRPWDVVTTSRFVSYASLGWAVFGLSFLLFRTLGC